LRISALRQTPDCFVTHFAKRVVQALSQSFPDFGRIHRADSPGTIFAVRRPQPKRSAVSDFFVFILHQFDERLSCLGPLWTGHPVRNCQSDIRVRIVPPFNQRANGSFISKMSQCPSGGMDHERILLAEMCKGDGNARVKIRTI
jgi:hypothetical protein